MCIRDRYYTLAEKLGAGQQKWQQYLLENVEQTMVQTQVLVHQAEEEAFQMPQAQQEELDQMSAMLRCV